MTLLKVNVGDKLVIRIDSPFGDTSKAGDVVEVIKIFPNGIFYYKNLKGLCFSGISYLEYFKPFIMSVGQTCPQAQPYTTYKELRESGKVVMFESIHCPNTYMLYVNFNNQMVCVDNNCSTMIGIELSAKVWDFDGAAVNTRDWQITYLEDGHNSKLADQIAEHISYKSCSCDFYTVIMPYGCKCGGK